MDLCPSNVSVHCGLDPFLLFNMLSRLVIVFLTRNKHLLILRLQSPSAVILEPKKIKSVTVSIVSPSICHEVMGPDANIFIFWKLSFKPTFSLSSFTFIKRLFRSSSLSARSMVSPAYTMQYYSAIKEGMNSAISSNMVGPRDDHSKWSKSEKDKYYMISLICGI